MRVGLVRKVCEGMLREKKKEELMKEGILSEEEIKEVVGKINVEYSLIYYIVDRSKYKDGFEEMSKVSGGVKSGNVEKCEKWMKEMLVGKGWVDVVKFVEKNIGLNINYIEVLNIMKRRNKIVERYELVEGVCVVREMIKNE